MLKEVHFGAAEIENLIIFVFFVLLLLLLLVLFVLVFALGAVASLLLNRFAGVRVSITFDVVIRSDIFRNEKSIVCLLSIIIIGSEFHLLMVWRCKNVFVVATLSGKFFRENFTLNVGVGPDVSHL